MATAQSPIKVYEATKERIRHGALLVGCNQAEFVDRAVAEYVERHRDDFAVRLDHAREALLGGPAATVAHAVGATEADIERIGGSSGQLGS
jgi:cytosine/adenosine deaminase-related metal-dependent hydrolase